MPRTASNAQTKRKPKVAARKATTRRPQRVAEPRVAYTSPMVVDSPPPTIRDAAATLPLDFPPLDPPELRFYGVIYIDDVEVLRECDTDLLMQKYWRLSDEHPDQEVALAWIDAALYHL